VDEHRTAETVELLQAMIRNECVNDGTPDSGGESRNAALLRSFLEGSGLDVETFEARPGRESVVARIEGSDPDAPSLCLMGHTDVVPVSPDGWREDPFGGELIDGEVWGRGAVDMLNLTSSMTVAFRHLARTSFRPRGDLIFFGVADEEAGGVWGARWMVEHHWDAIACDYVLTEMGGFAVPSTSGRRIAISVGEKGIAWRRLRVRGTPGHGSMPFGSDNALVKAAEIVRRLVAHRPAPHLDAAWHDTVAHLPLPAELRDALRDPDRVYGALELLPPGIGGYLHACSHTTISPNVVHGGVKHNVIPDVVDLDVDVRTMPGVTGGDVDELLRHAIGDLVDAVEISHVHDDEASESPVDTPMWDVLSRRIGAVYPDAVLAPRLIVGGTDARFFRGKDTVAYGAGLFSEAVDFMQFRSRFHGHDERVDVGSLALTTQLWLDVAEDLLG
jgi:acetylornithine deacetylase/succinyl-diaminopimelate desuccinylase-like protein